MGLDEDVVHAFAARGRTLAFAESVTGGLAAARLTRVPGAGDVLVASLVTYMDSAKRAILGVDAALLARAGAISPAVAAAMAEGARRVTGADVAVSLTGVAGPTAPEGLDVGLVYLSVATCEGTTTLEFRLAGSRGQVREQAALEAMRLALAALDPA